jgi:hypothetical protein
LTIQHNPPLFTSDTLNSYIMCATITPGNGLNEDSVFIFWRSDTLSPFIKQDLQSLGSDLYQAEIPAQSVGTILHYYFSAQDTLSNVVNLPLGGPRFKFKFYVATDFITFDFEDGLFLWETGGINNHWSLTSKDSCQGTFRLADSPPGEYQNNTDSWATIKKTFDLTNVEHPLLSFWHTYKFWSGDSGFVEINTDGGKGWEKLSEYADTQSDWIQVNLPLDSYTEYTNVRFRFHLVSDNADTADGWYIDDVQVNFKPTSVEEEPASVPLQFSLYQNYPNPFNPTTTIRFTVHGSQFTVHGPIHTTLRIYNVRGQLVKTLLDEEKQPGDYSVIWDGKNDNGEEVASGVYFYQLVIENNRITKKMVLLR